MTCSRCRVREAENNYKTCSMCRNYFKRYHKNKPILSKKAKVIPYGIHPEQIPECVYYVDNYFYFSKNNRKIYSSRNRNLSLFTKLCHIKYKLCIVGILFPKEQEIYEVINELTTAGFKIDDNLNIKYTSSLYNGVCFVKSSQDWRVSININGKINRAFYRNEVHAAYHYNLWIDEYNLDVSLKNNVEKPNNFILHKSRF